VRALGGDVVEVAASQRRRLRGATPHLLAGRRQQQPVEPLLGRLVLGVGGIGVPQGLDPRARFRVRTGCGQWLGSGLGGGHGLEYERSHRLIGVGRRTFLTCAAPTLSDRSGVLSLPLAIHTDATREAERLVRDPSLFKWYAVALLAFVVYAYANEAERQRWDVVAAGLALWFADWFNEIVNALVLQANDTAPLWATTGPTAYQFLIGLNVEISFMFALAGIVYVKLLPADRAVRILGMPNRLAIGLGLSIVSVAVELFLHAAGKFHWHYWWWNTPFVLLIVILGYLWFYLFAAWVYDAPSTRARWRRVGGLAAIDVTMGLVFGVALGWL
jgi:hypothetical protein